MSSLIVTIIGKAVFTKDWINVLFSSTFPLKWKEDPITLYYMIIFLFLNWGTP